MTATPSKAGIIVAATLTIAFVAAHALGQSSANASARVPRKSRLPPALLAEPDGIPFEVAPIDRSTRPSVERAAERIDGLIDAMKSADDAEPVEPLDDAGFVRRVYLELGGRIPTCNETLRFLATRTPDRRAELIDQILESPDYVSRMYCVWAETLRLKESATHIYFEPYLDWIKRSIAANRPYDEWVREMLTAGGTPLMNPAVGYQLRDLGMPLSYVDNTVRVFLGTRIGCAQCHDHPTEPWTQRQFYELAAFTSGDILAGSRSPEQIRRYELLGKIKDLDFAKGTNTGELGRYLANNALLVAHRSRPLFLPQADSSGASQSAPIQPKVPWGGSASVSAGTDGRVVLAEWLTSPANRQFARAIANRLWKQLMGRGIVDPIDDFSDGNPPTHPELLEHLTDEVIRLRFDIREFIRIVVSTRAWQNRAIPHDPTSGEMFSFRAPVLRRMTAEQLWDSIVTLASHDRFRYQRPRYEAFADGVALDLASRDVSLGELKEAYLRFLEVPSAFLGTTVGGEFAYGWYGYVRASEMPTPVARTHPLRVFGQSDRETIDGGHTGGTIMQALFLLNDRSFPVVAIEPGSMLAETIAERPAREWVDAAFFSILSRRPDAEEKKLSEEVMAGARSPADGLSQVICSLFLTREFIFIQ